MNSCVMEVNIREFSRCSVLLVVGRRNSPSIVSSYLLPKNSRTEKLLTSEKCVERRRSLGK